MKNQYQLFLLFLFFYSFSFSQSVELLVPRNNEELTDIAVSFKAKAMGDGPYILEVSKDITFNTGVKTQTKTGKYATENFVYFFSRYGVFNASKRFMLEPGTWYWKISDDGGATFSETRTLIVNNNKPQTPVERVISPEKPLFHFRIFSRKIITSTNLHEKKQIQVPD